MREVVKRWGGDKGRKQDIVQILLGLNGLGALFHSLGMVKALICKGTFSFGFVDTSEQIMMQ